MRLKDIHKELLELKNCFLNQNDWKYARKAFKILDDFEDEYRNDCDEHAGYSENLIRIKNSILMVDRTKAETQFIHGISSITDIIFRELDS
tara:strand:+ start:1307 stop:1579 length:273 start_codon:yes stop_codon:yes gene_type:complete